MVRLRWAVGPLWGVLATAAPRALLAQPDSGGAAAAATPPSASFAPWRVGPFIGVARNSPLSTRFGGIVGHDHLFIGLKAATPVLRVGPLRLSYAVQLLPAVFVKGSETASEFTPRESDLAYAFGASPFGLDAGVPWGRRLTLQGSAAAGGLIFSRPFPVGDAQRFSFTLEFGGGVLARVGRARWIEIGYKYHHLSNASTALANPGLNAHVVYVGYQGLVRLPRE